MGGKLDQIRGRIKEAGAPADDDGLKREGKLDQVVGKAKEKVKEEADKMKHTRSLPSLQEEVDVAARSSAQAPSEAALMRAVLEDALECFQMKFDIERPLAKRKAREAEEWFFNDDSSDRSAYGRDLCGCGQSRLGTSPIALSDKGGEQYEPDKEPGDALVGHLAHRDGLIASGYHSNSSHRYYTGSACDRCWRFDSGRSVSYSISLIASLMSDWNSSIALLTTDLQRSRAVKRQKRVGQYAWLLMVALSTQKKKIEELENRLQERVPPSQ